MARPERNASIPAGVPKEAISTSGAVVAWVIVLGIAGLVAVLILGDILRRSGPGISTNGVFDHTGVTIAAAAIGGIAAFGYGWRVRRMQHVVENTATSPARSLPLGFVEVAGSAEADGAELRSPFTDQPCVFYDYRVQELRGSGRSRRWVTVASEQSSDPFYLRDATGRVLIVPMGASARVSREQILSNVWPDALPDHVRRAMRRLDMPTAGWLGPRRIRCRERFIAPGSTLYVLGTAQENPAGPLDAVDTARVYIGAAPGGRPFLIADQSEHALLVRLRWMARLGIYGGPVLTAGALAWWVWRG